MTGISRRHFNIGAASGLAATALSGGFAFAQEYPSQDVHFVSAFPPGSGADLIVRWYAEKLRPVMGRNIIVENKVGALGNLATEYVARSKPDGHTIFVHGAGGTAGNMHLFKNPPVDVAKAIQLAATINKQPTTIAVHASKPWKTLADLTAYARQQKDKATYGTANPNGKVVGALYKEHEKLEAIEVIYRTTSDSINDLASGALDYAIYDNIFSAAQVREGRIRILGISTPQRISPYPDWPTLMEQNVPVSLTAFFAAMVPSATPRPIVEQINKMFNQVTATDDAKKFLNNAASDPWLTTPDEAQAAFLKEVKDWADYVRIAKIEPQG